VWAFAAVLCEMLTGTKTFPGDDVSDTLATVLKSDPAWGDLPDAVPERVRQLLRTCLEKDPRQRLHAVADARLAMEGAFETRVIAPAEDVLPPQLRVWQQPMPLAAGAFLLLVVGGLSVWGLTSPGPSLVEPVARFSLPLGSDQDFSAVGRHIVALAPNGDYVVYSANGQLFTRQLDQLQSTAISGTQGNSSSPFVSPDGEWIGFFAGGQLRKVAVSGGAPVTLCDARNPWGVSWGADDMVLFGQGPGGIWRVPGTGGTPEVLIAVEDGEQAHGPQMLPGSDWVLFTFRTAGAGGWNEADVVMQSVATGERVVLIEGARDARYVETGHLVYAVNGVLFAVAFDPNARALLGGPVPLVEGVRDATGTAATHFSLSLDGSLAYVPGAAGSVLEFVWVDREGREDPLPLPPRAYFAPRVSPDGTRLAVTVEEQGRDLWVFDAVSAAGLRLTNEGITNAPVWTPDGERVVFSWNLAGPQDVFWVPADGSGEAEQLTKSEANDVLTGVTPDGTDAIFARIISGNREVWRSPLEASGVPTPVLQGEFARGNAEVSPDGNWLTYRSNQSGQLEIYLEPYPGPGQTVPVSRGGGDLVTWSTDGSELYYRSGSRLMAVDVTPDGTVSPPVELFDGNYIVAPNGVRQYHVAPDGRFLMMRDATSTATNDTFAQVVLVQNWFEELKERVPVP
jgi:serine/threonine-protein kinase